MLASKPRPRTRNRAAAWLGLACLLIAAVHGGNARAELVTIAAASNFRAALLAIVSDFEAATGHRVAVTTGSTGQLFAQITNGAPFDILLAADQDRPRLLAEQGIGDPSSVFTFATGRLALWSRDPGLIDGGSLRRLGEADIRWFAIAEPAVAPYGAAARQVLESVGVWYTLEARIVRGQNVAQTFAMIETGNAELGLVALAQALGYEGDASYEIVPAELHEPVRQDAVLLRAGSGNTAALDFLEWLRAPATAAVIESHGYGVATQAR